MQLGRQVHSVLLQHMQRFTYSATGALRWKRDLAEYAEWARALRAPLLSDRFQELQVPRSSGPRHATLMISTHEPFPPLPSASICDRATLQTSQDCFRLCSSPGCHQKTSLSERHRAEGAA